MIYSRSYRTLISCFEQNLSNSPLYVFSSSGLTITNFAGIHSPLVGGRSYPGQIVSLTLTNPGTAGQGGDITAVSSPYSNYDLKVYYSSADPLASVGTVMTPTFSAADLRQGLAGGSATLSLTGTIDMDAITTADCQSITHICIVGNADTLNGASFVLTAAVQQCVAQEIVCSPSECSSNLKKYDCQSLPDILLYF